MQLRVLQNFKFEALSHMTPCVLLY